MLDDEGNLIGGGLLDGAVAGGGASAGKGGKRKRGEDDAYRPKGGSSRPAKKRVRHAPGTGKPGKTGGGGAGGAMDEE